MMTDGPRHHDDRPPRPKRSLASRVVIAISILLVVAGLLFLGWVYSVGQLLGEPGGTYLEIENRTNQTVKIFRFIEGYEGRFFYGKIPPHSSFATGDDCASAEMIATTSDGTEIARRGPFKLCNLNTWVIRDVSRP